MFRFSQKIITPFALAAFLAAFPLAAKAADTQNLNNFLPGLMLDAAQRNALETEELETNLFPSEKHSMQNYDKEELFRLYNDQQYNRVVFGLLRLARQGDAKAEETIGVMYRFGQGLQTDDEQALRWFARAAEGHQPLAQHHLGSMYYNGEGVSRDLLKGAMYMGLAVQNYAEGTEKQQAMEDLKNINLRLSRIEQEQAREMMRRFMDQFPKPS